MAFTGNFFGVSVEEAMVKSGIIDTIVKTLTDISNDPTKQQILKSTSIELNQYINQIIELHERIKKITRLTKEYLKKSTQNKRVSSREEYARKLENQNIALNFYTIKINRLILSTFKLEHKILDMISGGVTETAEYAIYFYGNKSKGEILRGTIKSQDLYGSKYIYVDPKGNLKISSDIIKAESNFQSIMSTDQDHNAVWDSSFAEDLESLVMETYSFLQDVQTKYSNLTITSKKQHLGRERDAQYDVSRMFSEERAAILKLIQDKQAQMYQFFFYASSQKPAGRLNRGHLTEAYERILQAKLAGKTTPTAYEALSQSLGNDPWYIGGDVGSVQVKSFFDNNDRKIANYGSIIQLGKILIQLIDNVQNAAIEVQQIGAQRLKAKESLKWQQGDKTLEAEMRNEIENLLQILKN